MTTNGIALKRKLQPLLENGLDQLNISLDTLDPEQYLQMTRRNGFEMVMENIATAASMPFEAIKVNAVMIRDTNAEQLLKFISLTEKLPISVRFIEYMPFGGAAYLT